MLNEEIWKGTVHMRTHLLPCLCAAKDSNNRHGRRSVLINVVINIPEIGVEVGRVRLIVVYAIEPHPERIHCVTEKVESKTQGAPIILGAQDEDDELKSRSGRS